MKQDTLEKSEHKKDSETKDALHALRESSLKAAGFSTLFADLSLIACGYMAGKPEIGAAGAFGLSAGFVGARYGNPKAEKRLEQIDRRLGEYLRKEGIEIPQDSSTQSLTRKANILQHVESFLYSNPSQVMNVFYSLIGVQFARSKGLLASGCFLIAGALSGLLIPEQKPDPAHPPHGALEKTWSWIQEKPLRLTGTLFNLNQLMLLRNALEDRKNNPANKSYVAKLLAVAGFTFGNIMMTISSKSHDGGKKLDEKTLATLSETSARVIAAQPQEVQNALLEHVSGFLASDPNINLKADEISKMLHTKLAEIAKAPSATDWQNRTGSVHYADTQPSV